MFHLKEGTSFAPWGLFVLRLVLGFVFLFHGIQKLGLWSDSAGMSGTLLVVMKVLSIVESLAGLALIVGAYTCFAAGAVALIMIGAIYFKQVMMNVGFSTPSGAGWEYDLVLLASALCIKLAGPGKFACKGNLVPCCPGKNESEKHAT